MLTKNSPAQALTHICVHRHLHTAPPVLTHTYTQTPAHAQAPAHTCAHTYLHTDTHLHTHTCKCLCSRTRIHTPAQALAHTRMHLHTTMLTCTHQCSHIPAHTPTHLCSHKHTCTGTCTHTRAPAQRHTPAQTHMHLHTPALAHTCAHTHLHADPYLHTYTWRGGTKTRPGYGEAEAPPAPSASGVAWEPPWLAEPNGASSNPKAAPNEHTNFWKPICIFWSSQRGRPKQGEDQESRCISRGCHPTHGKDGVTAAASDKKVHQPHCFLELIRPCGVLPNDKNTVCLAAESCLEPDVHR